MTYTFFNTPKMGPTVAAKIVGRSDPDDDYGPGTVGGDDIPGERHLAMGCARYRPLRRTPNKRILGHAIT